MTQSPAMSFIDYLQSDLQMITADREDQYIIHHISNYVDHLFRRFNQVVNGYEASSCSSTSMAEKNNLLSNLLNEEFVLFENDDYFKEVTLNDFYDVIYGFNAEASEVIKHKFIGLEISDWNVSKFIFLLPFIIFKLCSRYYVPKTGLVFAGYGDQEYFPHSIAIEVQCRIFGTLKYKFISESIIDDNNSGYMEAFAQREMVKRFMEGVDPNYDAMLKSFFYEILKGLLSNQPDQQLVDDIITEIQTEFENRSKAYRQEKFIDPIVSVIRFLPKDELAVVAETLINLTSFKRRISPESETVGGPIDVAVISKGDGFIWIKRKHYFDKDKNPHYISNNYPRR
jgi:hypothetical protein